MVTRLPSDVSVCGCMYARTSFRGAKLKKGCVFGHSDKFWKEHDKQFKENACKNTYLGSTFVPEKKKKSV